MLRSHLAILFALVIAIGNAPCASAAVPYEVTTLVSQTGSFGFIGKSTTEALHALEVYVNKTGGIRGRPIHFAISDVQSNPVVAVQLATQAMAKHPAVILGPELGAAAYAIAPITKNDTVLYSFSSSVRPPPGSYFFGSNVSNRELMFAAVRYLRMRGIRRIGVLATTDVTGNDHIEQIDNAMRMPENRSVSVVAVEHYAIGDINVTPQIARIKAAGAEAIFIGTTGTAYGTALHGLADVGFVGPVVTNAGNIIRAQMSAYASFMPKEMLFTGLRFMSHSIARSGPVRDAQTVFYDALKAQGITRPDIGYNSCWDSAWVVVNALRKFGPSMTAEQLHDYIVNLHGFAATNGIMDFRDGGQRGWGLNAVVMVRWEPAKDDWVAVSEPGGTPLR